VRTGEGPSAVVIHPDNTTAFVANRGSATVTKLVNINTGAAVAATVDVGSEPTGLALSPTGAMLFVAEWAEGRVSIIDTATMTVVRAIDSVRNPRAVAVTNNRDGNDRDETLVVTEFFGESNPDLSHCASGSAEACDSGRVGRVRLFNLSDFAPQSPIIFNPIDSGFVPDGSAAGTASVMTSPNQFYSVAIQSGKIYVTSVSASPQAPAKFNANVFPVVYVGDLSTRSEDRSNVGSANLAKLAEDTIPQSEGHSRFFLSEPVDLAFQGDSNVAYVISRASDVVQRVVYDPATGITLGTDALKQIDLVAQYEGSGDPGCQNPSGIVVAHTAPRAYVNCWISRRLAVIDLDGQTLSTVVQSSDLPAAGSIDDSVRRGARFYFTGRGRWSHEGEGYGSCGSCHPDGLSDNITWSFAPGPRQATSMDGSFSHGAGPQQQRIFNWTAINDEVHDIERVTRNVLGGLGAITTSATNMCGTLSAEQAVILPADNLGAPVKDVQDTTVGMCTHDWDDITEFVKTIRPPHARRNLDSHSVELGARIFAASGNGSGNGACVTCHGGAGWTVSRRFYTPSATTNAALADATNPLGTFVPPTSDTFWPLQVTQIGSQPAAADNTGAEIKPKEVACVLRNVGTFGSDALEKKADGTRAEGHGGFNVPSLYGLAVGAPYFHDGQAATLEELLSDPKWQTHRTAGNPNFAPSSAQVQDLVSYLLAIDASTAEQPVPALFDACPEMFRAQLNGDQEVPRVPTTSASGEALFVVSADEASLSFQLSVTGLDAAQITGAHIHFAPPGVGGPVVVPLATSGFTPPLRGMLTASDLSPEGGVNTFADLIAALRAGNTYVNVHSLAHPSGEIRGQIVEP
jgi:YVTN family beta-propeller protein